MDFELLPRLKLKRSYLSKLCLQGMGIMTLTAGIPELRPPACNEQAICIDSQKWQLAFLFSSFGLIALGAGVAFGADQVDTSTENGRAQLNSFFNWWYFSFTISPHHSPNWDSLHPDEHQLGYQVCHPDCLTCTLYHHFLD